MRAIHWLIGGIGLAGAGVAVALTRRRPPDPAAVAILQADLAADTRIPYRVRRHAAVTAQAALARLPTGWVPGAFARLLLGVLERESRGGEALSADGTGDHTARVGRYLRQPWVQVVVGLPAGWSLPRDRRGSILPPPYAIPVDGRGWGRSIWQIDFGAHAFARGPEVDDPAKAADYAAGVLSDAIAYWWRRAAATGWTTEALAVASYNAGTGGVKAALERGEPPDAATTGGNYGRDVLAMAAGYGMGDAQGVA